MEKIPLPLTHLVPHAARQAHSELLSALGTEANPAQWMRFMDAVTRLLPQVLAPGRPTREAIQRSLIGQLGFASWGAMVEAPVAEGGLGWNLSAWRAWRRAWAVVEAHPWLREQPMTASEVNTLANSLRRQGVDMPGSAAELERVQAEVVAEAEAQKVEQVVFLKLRLSEVEQMAAQATAALSAAQGEAEALREALRQADGRQQAQQTAIEALSAAQVEAEALRQELRATIDDLQAQMAARRPKMRRWQHLVAAIRG